VAVSLSGRPGDVISVDEGKSHGVVLSTHNNVEVVEAAAQLRCFYGSASTCQPWYHGTHSKWAWQRPFQASLSSTQPLRRRAARWSRGDDEGTTPCVVTLAASLHIPRQPQVGDQQQEHQAGG
jgi:hypothetical protein